jgi:hypothetical protein
MSALKVDALFEQFGHLFKETAPNIIKKVNSVYHFEVLPAKG